MYHTHPRKFKGQVFQEENEKMTLRPQKAVYHLHIIWAASLPVVTIVPSHIIFSATNCKRIKRILLMHITPLLGYCTADFPEYLSSAFLAEAKLASSCASSQIPSQKWKCRSCKIQLYLPHCSLPVFHRPIISLQKAWFKTLTVTLPFTPKVHWKCLNIYMSESVNHETNIYEYIRATS